MTKEKFIRIQKARGYEIEDLGKVVLVRSGKYTATWFFNYDGSVDEKKPPVWKLDR